jgi:hypothetical protein
MDPSASPSSTTHDAASPDDPPSPAQRAVGVLTRLRTRLLDQLVDYINDNEDALDAYDPDDRYSFTLMEVEDRYLSKLNITRRALAEIQQGRAAQGAGGAAAKSAGTQLVSRVRHVRVEPTRPLGRAVLDTVSTLGPATVSDIWVHDRTGGGHDVFIVYQAPAKKRGSEAESPTSSKNPPESSG